MYNRPPNYASGIFPSSATGTNTQVIAAPGANLAIRLVGLHASGLTGTTAADARFQSPNGSTILFRAIGGLVGSGDSIPEPGILLPINTGLFVTCFSPAGGNVAIEVYYFIDRIT